MDFRFTAEQEEFRKEVREFLEKELPVLSTPEDSWIISASTEFTRKMGEKGWIGMTWPKEYSGQGRSYIDRLILTEEMLRYGAPTAAHWFTDRQIGPAILAHGSEEQKKWFLPRIARGELVFSLGMSEPEAGSDLAAVRTKAIEDDKGFVLNGQKVWTSGAHIADYIYLVVRTDPEASKHKGISELIVDLKTPGITVRPLIDITGGSHFNEVFFDNARVPKTALIGQQNRGWYQIISQLDYERSGIERLMGNYPLLKDIFDYAKTTKRDGRLLCEEPDVRHKLAQLQVEFEVGRLLIYKVAWLLSLGLVPNYESALAKVYCTEFEQRLANVATQVLGLHGQLMVDSKWARLGGRVPRAYLYCPGYTIQGGTSEILRNIIARRGLGLPSG